MAMSKGCTIALVVFAIFVLLLIIGIVVVWINKDKIAEASLEYMTKAAEKEITANLPPGYTSESVHGIMEAFKDGVKSKDIDPQEISRIATAFQVAIKDKTIDQEEGAHVLALIVEALPPGTIPVDSTGPVEPALDSLPVVPDSL